MRLVIEKINDNPATLMRRAGYVFERNEGGEMSFVRVFARAGYPRFHIYTKLDGVKLFINFHLDQKRHTYGVGTRHHGEYDNEGVVQEESIRLLKHFGPECRIV